MWHPLCVASMICSTFGEIIRDMPDVNAMSEKADLLRLLVRLLSMNDLFTIPFYTNCTLQVFNSIGDHHLCGILRWVLFGSSTIFRRVQSRLSLWWWQVDHSYPCHSEWDGVFFNDSFTNYQSIQPSAMRIISFSGKDRDMSRFWEDLFYEWTDPSFLKRMVFLRMSYETEMSTISAIVLARGDSEEAKISIFTTSAEIDRSDIIRVSLSLSNFLLSVWILWSSPTFDAHSSRSTYD
jgi:hypothetical protein